MRTNRQYQSFVKHNLDQLKHHEFFDMEGIDALWEDQINGKTNHAFLIGLLITFNKFIETYIKPDQK